MPIQIHITLNDGESLARVLAAAGLLAGSGAERVTFLPAPTEMPGPIGGFPDAEPEVLAASVGNAAPVQSAETDTPAQAAEKRKRRTKAEMEAARAAEAAAQPMPAPVFVVSRFDGSTDAEFSDSGEATERLCELIAGAGEADALEALLRANGGLFDALPTQRLNELANAEKEARAVWSLPVPAPVVAAPTAIAYPLKDADGKIPARAPDGTVLDTSGYPLASVTADRQGAQNCIRVLASTAEGFSQARALLTKHGIERLSALPETDPKHGLVAAEAAAVLGLPMASAGGLI